MNNPSSRSLLDAVYETLDYRGGRLLQATSSPADSAGTDWIEVGDWLLLASRMGADHLFFVNDDPVLVFTSLPVDASNHAVVSAYKQAWCLTGPRFLFLAVGGEIRVYGLSEPPPKDLDDWRRFEPLHVVRSAVEVAETLREFRREQIETGQVFLNTQESVRGRADSTLLRDITTASRRLAAAGLDLHTAHGLIERLVLVRYLEDRGVINGAYLREVAGANPDWDQLLNRDLDRPNLGTPSAFLRTLGNIEFTNAIFAHLEDDFNGDIFTLTEQDRIAVQQEHLDVAQRLLSGSYDDHNEVLFLWAYDFSVVPTSLISNMYEQFYHEETNPDKATGTHYTPTQLVQFVLAKTLTSDVLGRSPRVIDPACGSGAFLVEAYRYLVRFQAAAASRPLTTVELRNLLVDQIAGIDTNSEAIRLAAFSLYVAFLNYQSPQDIRLAGPLPRLIRSAGPQATGSLVVADAFTPSRSQEDEQATLIQVERNALPWPDGHFDVVIGNPPWTEPPSARNRVLESWLRTRALPVGERNPSQAFLWRALALLKEDGVACMLVGATAFLNSRGPSRSFLETWLDGIHLNVLVNFTDVRGAFFSRAVAPFFMVSFAPKPLGAIIRSENLEQPPVEYFSARPSSVMDRTHSMAFARLDRRLVREQDLRERPYLWKVYGWGNHNDAALMTRLDAEPTLGTTLPLSHRPGYGYQRGQNFPSRALQELRSLRKFKPWGQLEEGWFEAQPEGVKRDPSDEIYRGQRIIVTQGVRAGFGPVARLVTEDFSFRHIIYAIPLQGVPPWMAKVALATLLSSVGRYRLFMLSGSWGVWHDCVYIEDVLRLPIRLLSDSDERVQRVIAAVDDLELATEQGVKQPVLSFFDDERVGGDRPSASEVLVRIDEAVFDIFELTEGERDLVRDFHNYTLPLNQLRTNASGLQPIGTPKLTAGLYEDLGSIGQPELSDYLRVLLDKWSPLLPRDGELAWIVTASSDSPAAMVALVPTRRGERPNSTPLDAGWRSLLNRFAAAAGDDEGGRVLTEGLVRAVTGSQILILKRNERRLWSVSAAREDAEATMLTVALGRR